MDSLLHRLPWLGATLLITAGCSSTLGAKKSSDKRSAAAPAAADCMAGQANCNDANATKSTSTPAPATGDLTQLGLADFCTFAVGTDSQGCFTCTPRDIPSTKCVAVPTAFDPAAMCHHDLDELSCDLGSGKSFSYDFDALSQEEQVYQNIPLLIFGAKTLLADKLDKTPKTKDLVFGSLDAIDNHKKEIFSGNVGPLADDIAALVKKDEPQIPAEQIDQVKAALVTAVATLDAQRKSGALANGDIMTLANALLAAMPADLTGPLLEKLDLNKVMDKLKTAADDGSITDLLKTVGGDSSLSGLIAALQAGGHSAADPAITTDPIPTNPGTTVPAGGDTPTSDQN